jgi:sugar phosphate isomerase/epimerase
MNVRPEANLNRRSLLKAAGAAAAAVTVPPALLRAAETAGANTAANADKAANAAKAKKNLKLGIFTGVYGNLPLDEAARRIREDGFSCVVLQHNFKDVAFDPFKPDWDVLKKIRAALEKNHLEIVGLFGYHNVIGPDEASRKRNEQFISLLINNWQKFGSPIISTETGTFNEKSQFAEDPKNFTEEGYAAARDALAKLARQAEKAKCVIAIEAYWRNLIGSVDRSERLFKDVDSPALKLTMDPCNYYKPEDLARMDEMLRDMFKRVGKQTVLAHAKDVRQTEKGQEHPASGLGVLNYPLYLRLLTELNREIPLVLEHLTLDDVPRARDYVKAQFDKI